MKISTVVIGCIVVMSLTGYSQVKTDHLPDYGKLLGMALNQDIKPILKELETMNMLTEKDKKFKSEFENRFKYEQDKSNYLQKKDTTLNALNRIYRDYWRKSMLDKLTNNDKNLVKAVNDFLKAENIKYKFTDLKINKKSFEEAYNMYIEFKGYHTTGFGKTGSLYDFLVWKTNTDTTYRIKLINDTIGVNVHFMDGFVSLGWEEYATLGTSYPGGWTTKTALYCVRKAYDTKSENFLISYLSHEGQHFSDYKHYPELVSNDLEYRAKLVELTFSNENVYKLIGMFINNAKYDKTNAHPFSNYCVIRDMSKLIFNSDIQNDLAKWKQLPKADINNAAKKLFLLNKDSLNTKGKDVKSILN
jgi:hypothetical protein